MTTEWAVHRAHGCGFFWPNSARSAALAELLDQLARFPEGVIADRHPAIDRLLQNDFLDVVGGEPALDQGRAHVHAEFFPSADRHHRADDEHAARALVEVRTGPDLAPGAAGDEVLP